MTDKEEKMLELLSELDGYTRLGEPDKAEKSIVWKTAIGLQQVDGLRPSAYLIETAKENIEGNITFDEVKERLDNYYKARPARKDGGDRTEEADKVSARIADILSEKTFNFSMTGYILIHKRLFSGIYSFAGEIRDYDITKSEWVLDGDTVHYAGADDIRTLMWQEFEQEKEFSYKGLSMEHTAEHISKFVSGVWQIHPFGEGNTRTVAVFAIKYLRKLGFPVTNDMFAEHSWYFRNSLVRANYDDHKNGVYATNKYINRFFGNLILGENNILRNRDMHISAEKGRPTPQAASASSVPERFETLNSLTASELKVFNVVAEGGATTLKDISGSSGVSVATVRRALSALIGKGLVKRTGSDKSGKWVRQ